MRPLREIRGLIYPDPYVIRHFFKSGLGQRTGRVLEPGCGSGNNLSLYLDMGWKCTGLDHDAGALANARHNLGAAPELIEADLRHGLPPVSGQFDVLILCGIICYLRREEAKRLLLDARQVMKPGALVFVRTRLIDDYRHGRGEEIEPDGFRIETAETGEAGLFNRFYSHEGLVRLLEETLDPSGLQMMEVRFDNIQGEQLIQGNSDVVAWGHIS